MQKAKLLRSTAQIALGIMLAAMPAALWIAWSATQVLCLMLVALLCAPLLVLLVESTADQRQQGSGGVALPPEFIEEVHRLFPLTYHHSRHETARFRQTMEKLAELAGVRRN